MKTNTLAEANTDIPVLTHAEERVVRLVALQKSNKEIADSLEVKECTVDKHIQHVMEKGGYHNRVGLAALALHYHFITVEEMVHCCKGAGAEMPGH